MKHILFTLLLVFSLHAACMVSQEKGHPTNELLAPQPDLTLELSKTLSNFSGNMRYEKCKELLEAGADPNGKHHAVPFLLCAAYWNDADLAEILLEHGANIHVRGYKNATALIYATRHQQGAPLCQVLLEYGADVNAQDDDGDTALKKSLSRAYHYAVTKLLLDNGARVDDLINFCKKAHISIYNYRAIIRHYRFYPIRTPQQLKDSQERIFNFLLCLKRNHPQFPRDLRRLILLSHLRDDTLNCPLAICKPLFYSMAPQVVRILFGQTEAIEMLKAYRYEQLTPILIEAIQRNPTDGDFQTLGTPYIQKFDSQIEEVITKDMSNQETK